MERNLQITVLKSRGGILNENSTKPGAFMNANYDDRPSIFEKKELLDVLIERENPDEMGLLDLIFVEEILNQKKMDTALAL